jgi:hypothetical protein
MASIVTKRNRYSECPNPSLPNPLFQVLFFPRARHQTRNVAEKCIEMKRWRHIKKHITRVTDIGNRSWTRGDVPIREEREKQQKYANRTLTPE